MESDLRDKLHSLRVRGMVDTSLKHTATVPVGGDLDTMRGDGVVDELEGHSSQRERTTVT